MMDNDNFLRDEKGNRSTARGLLVFVVPTILLTILLDGGAGFDVPVQAYGTFSTLLAGLLAWAGVPRAVEHLSTIASAFTTSKQGPNAPPVWTPHQWDDDEPEEGIV